MKTSLIFQIIFLFFITSLHATTWNGSVDSNWSNPSNWDGGVLPGALDGVFILDKPNQPTLDINANVLIVNVFGDATLTINAGTTLNIDASGTSSHGFANNGTVINNGTITILHNQVNRIPLAINIGQTFTNNGTLEINSTADIDAINLQNGSTLANTGTITITNSSYTRIYSWGGTITNSTTGTITGSNCGIKIENTTQFDNDGILELDLDDGSNNGFEIFSQSTFNNNADGTFEVYNANRGIYLLTGFCNNYGDMDIHDNTTGIANASSSVTINYETMTFDDIDEIAISNNSAATGAGFRNSGGATITIGNCTENKVSSPNSGVTINEGTIELLANNPEYVGGDISGSGTFRNEVSGTVKGTIYFTVSGTNNKGNLEPGNSPGIMSSNFTGFFLQPSHTLEIEVAGTGGAGTATGHDQLSSTGGPINANGTLNVTLISGFTPVLGNSFIIAEGAVINGTFSTVNFPAAPANTQWVIEYNATDITILLESTVPVELISFSAVKKNTTVLLEWETASEENNRGFEILKSNNGIDNWEKVAFVNGNGNSTIINYYSFLDPNPFAGNNYYRLMQEDFNGKTEYSEILNVQFDQNNSVHIFPNPIMDNRFSIQIDQSFNKGTLYIYDTAGQLKHTVSLDDNNEIRVDEWNLSSGIYIAEIYLDNIKVQQEKLIIPN